MAVLGAMTLTLGSWGARGQISCWWSGTECVRVTSQSLICHWGWWWVGESPRPSRTAPPGGGWRSVYVCGIPCVSLFWHARRFSCFSRSVLGVGLRPSISCVQNVYLDMYRDNMYMINCSMLALYNLFTFPRYHLWIIKCHMARNLYLVSKKIKRLINCLEENAPWQVKYTCMFFNLY